VLGRAPDADGEAHYLRLLQKGTKRAVLVAALMDSAEYRSSGRNVRIIGLSSPMNSIRHIFRRARG
jgi:hypothetical protein